MSPLVSILTSCFNGLDFIQQYGKSLCSQKYRPIECIIIDDGSTDGSAELLDELAVQCSSTGLVIKVLHQKNTGNAQAISNAFSISKGEYIACWDIDDIFFADNINQLASALSQNPECAAAHANGYIVNSQDTEILLQTFSDQYRQYRGNNLFIHLLKGSTWNWPGSYMIRANVLEEVYGARILPIPRLWKQSQNLQLLLPPAKIGSVYLSRPLMKYVRHQKAISNVDHDYVCQMQMWDIFEDIRIQLLEKMGLENTHYISLVKKSFDKIRLLESFNNNDENKFMQIYQSIIYNNKFDFDARYLKSVLCKEFILKKNILRVLRYMYRHYFLVS